MCYRDKDQPPGCGFGLSLIYHAQYTGSSEMTRWSSCAISSRECFSNGPFWLSSTTGESSIKENIIVFPSWIWAGQRLDGKRLEFKIRLAFSAILNPSLDGKKLPCAYIPSKRYVPYIRPGYKLASNDVLLQHDCLDWLARLVTLSHRSDHWRGLDLEACEKRKYDSVPRTSSCDSK